MLSGCNTAEKVLFSSQDFCFTTILFSCFSSLEVCHQSESEVDLYEREKRGNVHLILLIIVLTCVYSFIFYRFVIWSRERNARNSSDVLQCFYRVADLRSASQVHLQTWNLLFSHMLLSPSLITLWVSVCSFLGNIYVSVVQCVTVQCGVVCALPDTDPLCSPAGRLIGDQELL